MFRTLATCLKFTKHSPSLTPSVRNYGNFDTAHFVPQNYKNLQFQRQESAFIKVQVFYTATESTKSDWTIES